MQILENLTPEKWLELNAKLQQKKLSVMQKLIDQGHIQKDGKNNAQHYNYISEAGYKKHFQKLLTASGLSLSYSVDKAEPAIESKNGFLVIPTFRITDTETGFYEDCKGAGVGTDGTDKGIYKAQTGALKYFLANTFLVVGGDEPEKDDRPRQKKQQRPVQQKADFRRPTEKMLQDLQRYYTPEEIETCKKGYKVQNIGDLSYEVVENAIRKRAQ